MDPNQAGRELNARAVLTGRVTERGDQLIIHPELVDTAQESQLWGEKYTRAFAILAVQAEIASEVSKRLRLQLSDDENKRLIVADPEPRGLSPLRERLVLRQQVDHRGAP